MRLQRKAEKPRFRCNGSATKAPAIHERPSDRSRGRRRFTSMCRVARGRARCTAGRAGRRATKAPATREGTLAVPGGARGSAGASRRAVGRRLGKLVGTIPPIFSLCAARALGTHGARCPSWPRSAAGARRPGRDGLPRAGRGASGHVGPGFVAACRRAPPRRGMPPCALQPGSFCPICVLTSSFTFAGVVAGGRLGVQ